MTIPVDLWQGKLDITNELTAKYFLLCSNPIEPSCVGEKHHILPASMFPEYTKEKWNIVKITCQNHYLAHEILPQICLSFYDKQKMVLAWNLMNSTKDPNVEMNENLYAEYKEIHRTLMSNRPVSEYTKQKISDSLKGPNSPNYGKKVPDDVKRKMSEARFANNHMLGKKVSDEVKKKISLASSGENNGFYGKTHSEETKQLLSEMFSGEKSPKFGKKESEETCRKKSEALKGRVFSEETLQKMSEAQKGSKSSNYGKKLTSDQKLHLSSLRVGEKKPMYGRPVSEETKSKRRLTIAIRKINKILSDLQESYDCSDI